MNNMNIQSPSASPEIAEMALKSEHEIENMFHTILENSRDGINLYDLNTRKYIYINSAYLEMTGFTLEESRNFTDNELFERTHPEDRQALLEVQRQVMEGHEVPQELEYRWMVKNGEYRWFSDLRKVVKNEQGQPEYLVGITRDITEQKKNKEDINNTLETLEKKNELIKNFFINISHEFKTPISVLLFAMDMIEYYHEQPEQGHDEIIIEHYIVMKQNVFRLSKLINNLLDLNNVDAGFIIPKLINRDLVGVLGYLITSVTNYVKKKSVKISWTCSERIIKMPIDIQIIDRIMLNLISNALKHTQNGGYIEIKCERLGNRVVISVKDNGEGIPENKQERIFDRLRQVNTSLSRSCEGSGIGLALTKGLVEVLDGRIWFESKVGVGSQFFVELPIKQIDEEPSIEVDGMILDQIIQIELSDISL